MSQCQALPYFPDWPEIQSDIARDQDIEHEIQSILAQMTLEEKVGQMIQPDLREVTPEEVRQFKLGSVLNGGGGWPNDNKYATATDWAQANQDYYDALEAHYASRPFRIPFMWATDAVHGHNNVYRTTVFPHNIGLGAARDPDLIERIGRATALEIAATGQDWTFAPTVAVPRDYRWGRVYEGYSEDPEVVYAYAGRMVKGLQGSARDLAGERHVLASVKHWVGDGGTQDGVDRGVSYDSEEHLRNIHAMGYFSGLEAGAQVVMASFSSWTDEANYDLDPRDGNPYNCKIHGSKYLLTDVLKEKMGFDGLVVSDWNGHSEVSKCEAGNAGYCIRAGVDILMVTARADWQSVWYSTIDQVRQGLIPTSRIDDAVRRILRVKMRAGLWQKNPPMQRELACNESLIGCQPHRALAREAVRKSLVLLKNSNDILPLKRGQSILLAGSGAHDIQKQTGGWSLTWMGTENRISDFPGAMTIKMALEAELGYDRIDYQPRAEHIDDTDARVAVVVIGEDPYAEMMGDLKPWQTLEYASIKQSYAKDLETIRRLHAAGLKVITILFSGRPLYINEEINLSDALVAAWLPGSEGQGITDVLLRDYQGLTQYDFHGTLAFSWPMKKSSTRINRCPPHIQDYQPARGEQDIQGEHRPLFAYGYGLKYGDPMPEILAAPLPLDSTPGSDRGQHQARYPLELLGRRSSGVNQARIADRTQWKDVSSNSPTRLPWLESEPIDYQHQQDARALYFKGEMARFFLFNEEQRVEDRRGYLAACGALEFDICLHEVPEYPVLISVQADPVNQPCLDIQSHLRTLPLGQWYKVSVPLSDLAGLGIDFEFISAPFMLASEGPLQLDIGNIRWTA